MRNRPLLLCSLVTLGVLILLFGVLSVCYGTAKITPEQLWEVVLDLFSRTERSRAGSIVIDLRLPRVLMAICVGGGLGVVGVLLQTVTRNDLADPFLFGLSSGAAAGAVSVITVFGDRLGVWTLPAAAFTGGISASLIVLLLAYRMRGGGAERLILAGLAVSFLFTALTNYLIFKGDQRAAHSVLFWSLGGLGLSRWGNLPLAGGGLFLLLFYALKISRSLDALLAGEETAGSLGINPGRVRNTTFLIAAFATAIFVSITGIIGFIGLMVPHLARRITGPLHGRQIVVATFLGAFLLLGSDLAARLLLAPQVLPVGIITTSFGGLFVLLLLGRGRTGS